MQARPILTAELTSRSNTNLTRRELLIGGLAATICLHGAKSAFATASQPATSVNFKVPRNAGDCHTHIFGDTQRFPFALAAPTRWKAQQSTKPERYTQKELRS